MTKEFKIGIKISPHAGVEFFGIDDVNLLISQGARVLSIQQGDTIFTKIGEDEGTVRMVLGGCEMRIVIGFSAVTDANTASKI